MLRFLSARVEVDLACLSAEPVSPNTRSELAQLCRRVAIIPQSRWGRWTRASVSFARRRSATEGLFESRALVQTLRQWAEDTRYDTVVAYCSSMGQYLKVGRLEKAPCLVDFVDVDSQKWFDYAARARIPMRWVYREEGRRVRQLEAELVQRTRAVTVVSDSEAGLLRQFCPQASVQVVSNGVDLEHFAQHADSAANGYEIPKLAGSQCVFIGALDYLPNVDGITWFARAIWPDIHARFPDAKLVLVGRRPVAGVRRLARESGIELIGEVADVRPYLHRASLVVVPLRIARGIQNKVLEALAAGKPVVASPQALEGLLAEPARHVYRAATPAQWNSQIGTLLTDDKERQRLAAAGQSFVRRHHRWESCLQPLEEHLKTSRREDRSCWASRQVQAQSSIGCEP